jgi:hypothetical protein
MLASNHHINTPYRISVSTREFGSRFAMLGFDTIQQCLEMAGTFKPELFWTIWDQENETGCTNSEAFYGEKFEDRTTDFNQEIFDEIRKAFPERCKK